MTTHEQVQQLEQALKRVFSLPMSKMTLREVQNAVNTAFPDEQELTKSIMDSFMEGKVNATLAHEPGSKLKPLVEEYAPQVRFAREVFEFGEFMNIFSCDFLQQGNQVYFVNRMRRLDGQEYHFLSAPDTNVRLAHMFINRLRDLKRTAGNPSFDARLIDELNSLKEDIEALISAK